MTTDQKALADELERLNAECRAVSVALMSAIENRQDESDARWRVLTAEGRLAAAVRSGFEAILAALRADPGADVAAAYRAGLEAAALVCEQVTYEQNPIDPPGRLSISALASPPHARAIRALPVPAAVEVTEDDVAVRDRMARAMWIADGHVERLYDEIARAGSELAKTQYAYAVRADVALRAARKQP